ncbi:MAG: glycoside hydrolase family 97 N-terminal domain-containing protein [Bacteroidia bacterium]|nr:glycoside hydrolase family 97 N-terminal domain-containing protein [Bacteroidia bacterium]
MKFLSAVLAFHLFIIFSSNGSEVKVKSPDKKNVVIVKLNSEKDNSLVYSVINQGIIIVAESPLGLAFENQVPLNNKLQIVSTTQNEVNESWKPVYGEKNQYLNHYNETTVNFRELNAPFRDFSLVVRAYNEGIAFRYLVKTDQPVTITREFTGFKFKKDFTSWIAVKAQAKYSKGSISKTGKGCERPYVIEIAENKYIALGEATLVDHARMKFDRSETDSLLLLASLDGKVEYKSSFSTPWRYVMIADSPGKLLEQNSFILNLNDPSAIKDVSWIRPGKVIREVTLTTVGGKACVDFAARHNIAYVEFDAGWYGPENSNTSDATTITVDPARSPGPLALHDVISYGKERGIGTILYVNQKALSRQLDTILPLYQFWGVKGIKYGFVDVGSQKNTSWLHEAIRKAAKYQLMLDIHDEYRPTGYSRTYPNLLTQEGIRGDEESPDNQHVLITIFTRMLAGAGDHTNCYFAPRVEEKMGSHVSQMAKAICIYSPWQFVYWYDRPENSPRNKGGAGQTNPFIPEIEDLSFYDALPTVWDNTKVLEGKIGEYVTIARKSEDDWFVGSLTDQPRKLTTRLKFLDKGAKYEATIYIDDSSLNTPARVRIIKKLVSSVSQLSFDLKYKNGLAIILKKVP